MYVTCRGKKKPCREQYKKHSMKTSTFTLRPHPNNIWCQTHLHTNNHSFFYWTHWAVERHTNYRRAGNHPSCGRENVLRDNLQPRACRKDAEFYDKSQPLSCFFLSFPPQPPFSPPPPKSFLHSPTPLSPPSFLFPTLRLRKYVLLSYFLPAASLGWCSVPESRLMCLLKQRLPPTEELKLSSEQAPRLFSYCRVCKRSLQTTNAQII